MKKNLLALIVSTFLMFSMACNKDNNTPIDPNIFTPMASFTYSETIGVNSVTITFTNTTQNAHTYSWDFGDYNTSTEKNPTHTYPKPASKPKLYNVALTAYDTVNKTKNTRSKAIEIKP